MKSRELNNILTSLGFKRHNSVKSGYGKWIHPDAKDYLYVDTPSGSGDAPLTVMKYVRGFLREHLPQYCPPGEV